MNTAQINAIFVCAALFTITFCSTAICTLSAILLSWRTNLSPPIHDAVDSAFADLVRNLGFALTSSVSVFVYITLSLAALLVPTWRASWPRTWFAEPLIGVLWAPAVVTILVFCVMSEWHPCSVMSQLQLILHPEAIPGAIGACRELMTLEILAAINLLSMVAFPFALCQMQKQSRTRPTARLNRNRKNKNNDKKTTEAGNEVDLSEMAHHLEGIVDV